MVDKIDMSLDDIIKTNKIGFRRGGATGKARKLTTGVRTNKTGAGPRRNNTSTSNFRGRQNGVAKGRPQSRGGVQQARSKFTRGDVNSAWKHDMFDGGKKQQLLRGAISGLVNNATAKLLVSNLDYGVSETDIHELFADFGPLKGASVHYDRSGRSLGTADVVFERRADAVKAMKQYNGVPLDGRPMNIQVATSELPQVPTARSRLSTGPGINKRPQQQQQQQQQQHQRKVTGKPNNRTNGAGGGRPANKRQTAKPVSAEDLDAELDAYVNDMKS